MPLRWTLWFLSMAVLLPLRASNERAALAILEEHWWACHGAAKMSDLDLRSRATMLRGGKRAPRSSREGPRRVFSIKPRGYRYRRACVYLTYPGVQNDMCSQDRPCFGHQRPCSLCSNLLWPADR